MLTQIWCLNILAIALGAVNAAEWGTYRPNVYFGIKAQLPKSPLFGLMWFDPDPQTFADHIRHDCEERDGLDRYGWIRHDGRGFGVQELIDSRSGVNITTEFIRAADNIEGTGGWAARVTAQPIQINGKPLPATATPRNLSLVWYVALENSKHALGVKGLHAFKPLAGAAPVVVQVDTGEDAQLPSFAITATHAQNSPAAFMHVPKQPPAPNAAPARRRKSEDKEDATELFDKTAYVGQKLETDEVWNVHEKVVKDQLLREARKFIIAHHQAMTAKKTKEEKDQAEKERWREDKDGRMRMKGDAKEDYMPKKIIARLPNSVEANSNVIAFQQLLTMPFSIDFVMAPQAGSSSTAKKGKGKGSKDKEKESQRDKTKTRLSNDEVGHRAMHTPSALLDHQTLTDLLAEASANFSRRFEDTFHLQQLGYTPEQQVTRAAFVLCVILV